MWRLLILVATLQLAHATCPEGYDLVKDGECRGKAATLNITLDQAASAALTACELIQGKPVIIHDEEHQIYWTERAASSPKVIFTLGITCNENTGRYLWTDGSKIDYKPKAGWAPELDSDHCSTAYSFDLQSDGYWTYGGKGSHAVPVDIYCTTQLAPPPPGANGCDTFADDSDDGVCYQVGATAQNWQEARTTCKKVGAELASIHNQQENNFVRRLAVSKGAVNGVFVGASKQQDGSFAWADGTKMDYENYFPGFPKKNFGDCIAMDTSEAAGQWMNTDCATQLPVACIREQGSVESPKCTGEDYDQGAVILSPGFPNTASVSCDWFLSVEPGKKVQMEISILEANSCCDSLILYDGYIGAPVIQKLSGSIHNVTYTTSSSNIMRVSWQPEGGVNVRGVAFTYRAV